MSEAQYTPHSWKVEKDTIYTAITAVQNGIEYTKECLAIHDTSLGRSTEKNKIWAETMEYDIRQMEIALELLNQCGEE